MSGGPLQKWLWSLRLYYCSAKRKKQGGALSGNSQARRVGNIENLARQENQLQTEFKKTTFAQSSALLKKKC